MRQVGWCAQILCGPPVPVECWRTRYEGLPEGHVLLINAHKDRGGGIEGQVHVEASHLLAHAHHARPRLRALRPCRLGILVILLGRQICREAELHRACST